MIKIYISGGISKVPDYETVFYQAGKNLKYNGLKTRKGHIPSKSIEIINPVKLPHDHDHTYWSYMRECVRALTGCKIIYMLKGWWKSKGARIELIIALLLNISVEFEK